MLDHPGCILDRWSNNHPVAHIGPIVTICCFPVLSKTPGYGMFWRCRRIPRMRMNTFGLEWISTACLNLPRWNEGRRIICGIARAQDVDNIKQWIQWKYLSQCVRASENGLQSLEWNRQSMMVANEPQCMPKTTRANLIVAVVEGMKHSQQQRHCACARPCVCLDVWWIYLGGNNMHKSIFAAENRLLCIMFQWLYEALTYENKNLWNASTTKWFHQDGWLGFLAYDSYSNREPDMSTRTILTCF